MRAFQTSLVLGVRQWGLAGKYIRELRVHIGCLLFA